MNWKLIVDSNQKVVEERTEVHGEVNSAAALDASEVNLVVVDSGGVLCFFRFLVSFFLCVFSFRPSSSRCCLFFFLPLP